MSDKTAGILVSHPTGNANLRAVLRGFYDAGILEAFFTTIAVQNGSFLKILSQLPGLGELGRRSYDEDLSKYISTSHLRELCRIFAGKAGLKKLIKHETGYFSVDKIYHSVDSRVASALKHHGNKKFSSVYAYEDGALLSFREAHKQGIRCLYDLPIGYWRAARLLMQEEIYKRPEWATSMSGFIDSQEKTQQKDDELLLADHIFVASTFTAKTLKEFPGKLSPVSIIPYGFPAVTEEKIYDYAGQRPLKLLFVGGLSQRKGIADVIDAAAHLGNKVELTIIGKAPETEIPALRNALNTYKWYPSMPHQDVLKKMREADILLFPSLFEGFGLVITEAMSQGTPVITTDRTAGPDLIRNQENGWLIEAGSSEALINCIAGLLSDPSRIKSAGQQARETAKMRPWSVYGRELSLKILSLLNT